MYTTRIMKTLLHKAEDRGKGEYGWLSTRYSFSFGEWYDPARMGFGKLRVFNDDVIAGGAGFPSHGHRSMEIITIVMEGAVAHEDSMGHSDVTGTGEVQIMSAGSGVMHAEYNNSETDPLKLFQIWIEPRSSGGIPSYHKETFNFLNKESWVWLVGESGGTINQDAYIAYRALSSHDVATYSLHKKENGVYLFVVEGEVKVGEQVLGPRDALGVVDVDSVEIQALQSAKILVLEVSME